MKVLVATSRTQGRRTNDYHWCDDGELVMVLPVCATDREDPDGGCGCGRGFAGMDSHKATTTAEVRDLNIDEVDLFETVWASLQRQGWDPEGAFGLSGWLSEVAADWPVGTVVERRLDEIRVRQWLPENRMV